MKKLLYKPGTLLALSLFLLSASLQAQELTKEYHEEYTARKGMTLDLDNKYGDIVVYTSDNDQVVIDVKVTLRYPDRDRAERLLSYIDVRFSQDNDVISVKTNFDDRFRFTGWGSTSRRFSINYNVKMPVWMNLDLSNRYGDTDLDDLTGLVNIDIKYGNINASKLARGNEKPLNSISLAYGKGNISETGWLDLYLRYCSDFILSKNQALLLDSKYSKMKLGSLSSVVGETKYDNIRIDDINNLVLDAGYADINVGKLSKKLELEGAYGSFSVDAVPGGFESIDISSRYSGVSIGIDPDASYDLEAKLSYGGLKYNEDNFLNRKRIIQNNSTEISGIVGSDETTLSTVRVNASYGSVKLY